VTFKSLEEQREYMRQWRARNPDYQKQLYAENLEKRRAEKRAQYRSNREEHIERVKLYREKNPEKVREQKRRYRTENADKEKARIKKWVEDNPDKAIVQNAKRILREQFDMPIRDIPADLAAAKAEQLKISRWVREQLSESDAEDAPRKDRHD
jgi:hypothetical protein